MVINDDGMTALIAGVVLQAVEDYRAGYNRVDRPCSVAFLESCGLLVDGQLDKRFDVHRTRSGRPSNYGLGQPKHAA
jgi:hypothetical protein